eukprot:CAMPEP_0114566906 /NCGR_PEP_ID=MMETSP0114-20121206/15164_1 /TAXON_ID=31324 /ORGANISM="Goniomonas sp, Strain m" /LENGTH=174 /DNA_ID=CAMNT_0001753393 /DNA_START=328 /DNA_END=850 /DNA_ORIENTATION=+
MIILGGANLGGPLFKPEVLDTSSMTWTAPELDDMPGREMHTTTRVDDRLFVFGGRNESGLEQNGFILAVDSLRLLGMVEIPLVARCGHAAESVGKNVVVFGGTDMMQPPAFNDTVVFTFDGTQTAPEVADRFAHTVSRVGGRLFLWGGINFEKDLNDVSVLPLESLSNLPLPRA